MQAQRCQPKVFEKWGSLRASKFERFEDFTVPRCAYEVVLIFLPPSKNLENAFNTHLISVLGIRCSNSAPSSEGIDSRQQSRFRANGQCLQSRTFPQLLQAAAGATTSDDSHKCRAWTWYHHIRTGCNNRCIEHGTRIDTRTTQRTGAKFGTAVLDQCTARNDSLIYPLHGQLRCLVDWSLTHLKLLLHEPISGATQTKNFLERAGLSFIHK